MTDGPMQVQFRPGSIMMKDGEGAEVFLAGKHLFSAVLGNHPLARSTLMTIVNLYNLTERIYTCLHATKNLTHRHSCSQNH